LFYIYKMNLLKYIVYINNMFFLGLFFSCEYGKADKVGEIENKAIELKDSTNIKWVEGVFEFNGDNGIYREKWKKISNTEYLGFGYFFLKSDTLFKMQMKLYKVDDDFKMSYLVNGQNEGKESNFTLTSKSDNEFVFENPFRSFPTIIKYKFTGDSIIEIHESGFEDKKEKRKEFVLTKVKKQLFF
jgi:hypothetical protein